MTLRWALRNFGVRCISISFVRRSHPQVEQPRALVIGGRDASDNVRKNRSDADRHAS